VPPPLRGFALRAKPLYIPPMAIFPRPVSPKSALGDFWSYFLEQRSHKWPLLGLSAAMTWVIIWAFVIDGQTNTAPRQNKIIYVQSWDANRSDAAIILQQKMDLAKSEVALRKKQKEMQNIADVFGIDWREDEARDRKSTRLNSSHNPASRMPSSA
jgi:hypothetical protein